MGTSATGAPAQKGDCLVLGSPAHPCVSEIVCYQDSVGMSAGTADQRVDPGQAGLRAVVSKLWSLTWPLSWNELLTLSTALVVVIYVGHNLPDQLGALVLAQSLYQSTGTTVLLGLSGALETCAGQAFGAEAFAHVGEVLQQALATALLCCCGVLGLWAWMKPLMVAVGQDPTIAAAASKCLLALAPALVCEAANQCCRLYLAAQSVVRPAVVTTLTATLLLPAYLHVCCRWLGLSLFGVALAWNAVQATSLSLMVIYCVMHTKTQPEQECTWPGWSFAAFRGWGKYLQVAVPSCLMLCSESWATEMLVLLSGLLPNPQLSISTIAITANMHDICYLMTAGLGSATSTRVAQSLGGGRPSTARLTVMVALGLGTAFVWACIGLMLAARHKIGQLFTSNEGVLQLVAMTIPAMALSLLCEGTNTALAGTIRGCGKQKLGAVVGLIYWAVGLPLAWWLAFEMHLGGTGLWIGMMGVPTALQMLLNGEIVYMLDWQAEASKAQQMAAAGEHSAKLSNSSPRLPIFFRPQHQDSIDVHGSLDSNPGDTNDADRVQLCTTELALMPSVDRPLLTDVWSCRRPEEQQR